MNVKLAAKAPPLAPGEFRFITKAVQIEPSDGGKRRFKMVASSTVVDEGKDEVKLSALHDLEQAFKRGLNIFTDHEHKVDNVFGRTDTAQIMDSGVKDAKSGAPIYDLHIAGVVNEPDPRMVRLADSIDGGYVTFGASIGARVLEHQRNKAGGMDIYHLDGKEASLVGIPMNQRSWTYKAAKAAEALDAAAIEDDDEDDEPAAKALDTSAGDPLIRQDLDGPKEKADKCPTCGKDGDAGECSDDYHTAKSASVTTGITTKTDEIDTSIPTDTAESDDAAAETSPETEDGQASESAPETPETASPEDEDDANVSDTPTEEKAYAFESDDVFKLATHARDLAQTVSDRDDEITALKAERDTLAEENDLAKQVIEKMVTMPLRSKTAGYVEDTLVKRLPSFLAPEVKDYLSKNASGDNK